MPAPRSARRRAKDKDAPLAASRPETAEKTGTSGERFAIFAPKAYVGAATVAN
jgi:hypothetical protein